MSPLARFSYGLAAAACVLAGAGCSNQNAPKPIPPVAYERLEPAVAKAVRDAEASVDATKASRADKAGLARAFGKAGMVYQAQGLLQQAEVSFANAIEFDPSSARWKYLLAHVYRDSGRLELARDQFAATLEADPGNVAARIYLGDSNRQLGNLAAAATAYESAASVNDAKAAALAGLGKVALAQKRFPEAVQRLEEALRLWPTANQLHNSLAIAYRETGENAKAEEQLRRHNPSGFEPGIPDPLIDEMRELTAGARMQLTRGAKAHAAGRPEIAEGYFREAVKSDPRSFEARLNLGAVLANRGELKEAQEHLSAALALDPKSVMGSYSLGMVFDRQGADRLASDHYERAIALDPDHVKAKYFLAEAQMRAARYREAARLFGEVMQREPRDVAPALGRASAEIRLGNDARAKESLEAALAIDGSHPIARNALARVLSTARDPKVRSPRRALELAQDLFARYRNLDAGQTLAMALAANGLFDQAATLQRATIIRQRESGHMVPSAHLMRNLAAYEKRQGAAEAWPQEDPWFRPHSAAASGKGAAAPS